MNDDRSEHPPWDDPQIPTGMDSKRVYTRAIAVGGARRRRRRRRRTIGVTMLCVLGLASVVGLAGREGRGTRVVVAGNDSTSTTTTLPVSTTIQAVPKQILALGDSVMLGAEQSLRAEIPGMFVDAKVSRQFWDATTALKAYDNERLLPPTIIVAVGSNGAFSDPQFAALMGVVGDREIYFVNVRLPRTWETAVNQRLATNVREYPNAHLIDWHEQSSRHADWFVRDGIHLSAAGTRAYADLIRDTLRRIPTSPTTSTR